MTWQRILTFMAAIALGAMAWRAGGGAGLALLFSGVLNAKLKPRMPLLNVIALTRSLGERLSAEGAEPEVYRWRDPGDSHVTTEFEGGRLLRWQLQRPPVPSEPDAAPPLPAPGAES